VTARIRAVGYLLLILAGVALTGAGPRPQPLAAAGPPAAAPAAPVEAEIIKAKADKVDLDLSAPPDVRQGQSVTVTVTAVDADRGRRISSYSGLVRFSSTDPSATLPGDYRFTTGDDGEHQFTVTFRTTGNQNLRVVDVDNPSAEDQRSAIRVVASTRSLELSGTPASITSGQPFTYTVRAVDSNGVTVADYRGRVRFSSSDSSASLPSDYTFTSSDAGRHTFTATLRSQGRQSLRVSDGANGLSDDDPDIDVIAGPPDRLELTDVADPIRSGERDDFRVRALRPGGSVATEYRGRVRFESSDPNFQVIPQDYQFKESDNGEHRFQVVFNTVGEHRLKVIDVDRSNLNDQVDAITVTRESGSTSTTSSTSTSSTSTTSTTTSSSTSSTSSTSTSSTSTTSSTSSTSAPATTTTLDRSGTTSTTSPTLRIEEATVSNPTPRRGQTVTITGGKPPFQFRTPQQLTVELVGGTQTLPLGTIAALGDGSYMKADILIPATFPTGDADIVVSGVDANGIRLESIGAITVQADTGTGGTPGTPGGGGTLPRTGWSSSLLTLAIALALGGVGLLRSANDLGDGGPPLAPALPRPARFLAPRPARFLAPRPARFLAPRPARFLAPRPTRFLAPRPARFLAPRPPRGARPNWPLRRRGQLRRTARYWFKLSNRPW